VSDAPSGEVNMARAGWAALVDFVATPKGAVLLLANILLRHVLIFVLGDRRFAAVGLR